jgi:hypothetical protein
LGGRKKWKKSSSMGLMLGTQTNCKNWVGKEKLVELSMCSHTSKLVHQL